MKFLDFQILEFNPHNATDEDFELYFDILETWVLEMNPGEKLTPREVKKKEILTDPPKILMSRWIFIKEEENRKETFGYILLQTSSKLDPNYDENRAVGRFYLFVKSTFRGQGYGEYLLKFLLKQAEKRELKILQCEVVLQHSWSFFEKYQGKVVLEVAENRLYLDKVNWEMMNEWLIRGREVGNKEGVALEIFQVVPDEFISDFVDIYSETFNQQPFGEMAGRSKVTIESRRAEEEKWREAGNLVYTGLTIESKQEISGITEIIYNPDEPELVYQLFTGVREKYRGRGLGKWLKAEMIYLIKDKLPKAEYISTGNADANAPMLSINERMGFQHHQSRRVYQFKVEELRKLF